MPMPQLQVGDVVLTSRGPAWTSKVVAWFSRSKWTHVFMVGPGDLLLESYFPVGVSTGSVAERFDELLRDGQEYQVLRFRGLTPEQQLDLYVGGLLQEGRKYDILQAVLYGLFRVFIQDGPLRVICSRFITVAFDTARIDLFPAEILDRRLGAGSRRYSQLRRGWCAPQELLDYSALDAIS